jgi:hypothetical protein
MGLQEGFKVSHHTAEVRQLQVASLPSTSFTPFALPAGRYSGDTLNGDLNKYLFMGNQRNTIFRDSWGSCGWHSVMSPCRLAFLAGLWEGWQQGLCPLAWSRLAGSGRNEL